MTAMSEPAVVLDHAAPIEVAPAFRRVNAALGPLLASFSSADWLAPTIHRDRDVKDLVAHLLHGSLRRVSAMRDRYAGPPLRVTSAADLTAAIQADNRAFMDAMRRISPQILCEQIAIYDDELLEVLEALDPQGDGLGVVWAGEWRSKNWFDVAREYTEKWHHQQQLRDATGRPALYDGELLGPALETFARGLPHAYRSVERAGACVSIEVTGAIELRWSVVREPTRWVLRRGDPSTPSDASLSLSADTAWRLWTKGLAPEAAREAARCTGPDELTGPALSLVAIMA